MSILDLLLNCNSAAAISYLPIISQPSLFPFRLSTFSYLLAHAKILGAYLTWYSSRAFCLMPFHSEREKSKHALRCERGYGAEANLVADARPAACNFSNAFGAANTLRKPPKVMSHSTSLRTRRLDLVFWGRMPSWIHAQQTVRSTKVGKANTEAQQSLARPL